MNLVFISLYSEVGNHQMDRFCLLKINLSLSQDGGKMSGAEDHACNTQITIKFYFPLEKP